MTFNEKRQAAGPGADSSSNVTSIHLKRITHGAAKLVNALFDRVLVVDCLRIAIALAWLAGART